MLDLHILEPFDGGFHGLEVSQHAAQPTLINKGYAGAAGLSGNGFARLAFGAHHQHSAAFGRDLPYKFSGVLKHRQGFFQVDDVDFVAVSKNERRHLRIPKAGLMSKMNTRLKHFAHGD